MDGCLFCKIARGEIPAEKIYEDEYILAFLDITPRSPGHTMVIPKEHARNLLELPSKLIAPFFEGVQKVLGMIHRALEPDGFTLGMNQGKVSGQEVDHLHFHIMPRWHGDGGHSVQSVISNIPQEELKAIGEKIRSTEK